MGLKTSLLRAVQRHLVALRPRVLWRRYVLALFIVTVVVSASHLSALAVLRVGATYSDLQSISVRQLMLSQRIMYKVHELALEENILKENRLRSAIRLFEDSHDWIVSNPNLSDRVRAHYFSADEVPLDALSRQFVALTTRYLESEGAEMIRLQRQIADWGADTLLASLGEAVRLIEEDISANVQTLKNIQSIAFVIAILVLFLEALLIFFPAHLSISRAFKRLETRNHLLRRSMDALKTRNQQLSDARRDLHHAANHDALTGLFNRRAMLTAISETLDRQSREGGVVGLLKIDLDFFKNVNDTHGHKAGDQVLTTVADRLTAAMGPNDVVARIGGDEFVVLAGAVQSVPDLKTAATDIITKIREPIETDAARCHIGASIGLTVTNARDATRDQLLVEADLALYEAKREGRCRTKVFSKLLQRDVASRRALLGEITQALENDEFDAFLQPQVDAQTGELFGCEMLARWHHPKQGTVLPSVFLDAAREAGLLRRIDHAITARALDILEMLRDQGIDLPHVSVNACAETLRDPHYVDWLKQVLAERHLTPADLVVEILESTLIENDNDLVLRTVEQLTRLGVSVVLDDFGTGYATMSTLTRLRLSGIKIDRSLIDPLPEDRARSIVAALVALSRNLGMMVVAEGVEAPRHFAAVRAIGCDVIQGFGVARPMSAEAFLTWYATRQTGERNALSG